MSFRTAFLVAVLAGITVGCTTVKQSHPQRTATEQLLISRAADEAVEQLLIPFPPRTNIFVEPGSFEAYDQKYVIGAVKDHLLKRGVHLVDDKAKADVIVEVRSGALSVNKSETLIGIPSYEVPVPLSGPFKLPEVALFKDERQEGIAKFAMTAYGAETGEFRGSSGPVYGFSHRAKWIVLQFFSWTDEDLIPNEQKP